MSQVSLVTRGSCNQPLHPRFREDQQETRLFGYRTHGFSMVFKVFLRFSQQNRSILLITADTSPFLQRPCRPCEAPHVMVERYKLPKAPVGPMSFRPNMAVLIFYGKGLNAGLSHIWCY